MDEKAFVVVSTAPDLAAAEVVRGALESEGIEGFLPDETAAGQLWHLSRALGGIRVAVKAEDAEKARAVLEEIKHNAPLAEESPIDEISKADRVASRALKTAVIGFLLPPFFHPYALSLALRSLRLRELSRAGRKQAWVAAILSVAVMAATLGFLAVFLRGV